MRLNSDNRLEGFDRSLRAQSNGTYMAGATVTAVRKGCRETVRDQDARRRRAGPQIPPPAPIMFSVALQPDETITGMNRAELIDLIRLADLPPTCEDAFQRLDFLGRTDLERLAFLTRRCCRNQINSYSQFLGKSAPFIGDV
jgi:hypothetical protein